MWFWSISLSKINTTWRRCWRPWPTKIQSGMRSLAAVTLAGTPWQAGTPSYGRRSRFQRFSETGPSNATISVVMIADYSGTHKTTIRNSMGVFEPTGKSFDVKIVNVIDFIGDKISRETIYMDLLGQWRSSASPN